MAKKVSRRVKTLSGFMKWAEQFNDGQYLFRGVSKHTYKIEASAYRRLPEADRNNPTRLLKINRELIDKARLLGHDQKDGHYLSDLELLAELQHFGAATCLVDFTRSAQIALWFACQQSSSGEANGKVFAMRSDDPTLFRTVTPKLVTEEDIEYFFKEDERGRCLLYQWQPKQQNNRVIAQQSVFIFGGSEITAAAECVILKSSKSEILDSLDNSASITEASIYPDFDGFARLHAQNKPYIEPNILGYLQRGFIAQMENNLDDAITYYSEVISLQPDSSMLAKAYAARASIYVNKREYNLAIADFTRTIEEDPNEVIAYYGRGTIYGISGEHNLAIKDYTKALELNPEFAQVYIQRGTAYVANGKVDLALEDYKSAMELSPNDAMAYVQRGIAYGKKGGVDRAINDFTKAISLKPEFAEAYYTRGAAYIEKNEFDLAISDCTKAIELDPNDAKGYYWRGRAYDNKGDLNLAVEEFIKAIQRDPEFAEAYLELGRVYCAKGDNDMAVKEFTKAIEVQPDDADYYWYRGLAYRRKGDLDLSIGDFTEAIERNPEFAAAYLDRGCVYDQTDDFDRALDDFTKLIQLRPDDAEAYYLRGLTHGKKGDLRKALNDFTKMIEVNPGDGNAYYYRVDLRLHLREWEKAKSDLIAAADKGIDVIAQFHQLNGNIVDFEQKIGVQLPEDIAAMLTQ